MLNKTNQAIEQLKQNHMIILVDDGSAENEGFFVLPIDGASNEKLAFLHHHCGGKLSKVIPEDTTQDRTYATLPNGETEHFLTFHSMKGGVLKKAGIQEGAIDLLQLAELHCAPIIGKILNKAGSPCKMPEIIEFANEQNLVITSIEDLIGYRRKTQTYVVREAEANLPTAYGDFRMVGFVNQLNGEHHVALVKGIIEDGEEVLVRVHSECLTGDAFHSLKCDCGEQLAAALAAIEQEGKGVLLYLRQEGRGIGLINKIKAYKLQEQGMDTEEANIALGFAPDLRDYGIGAQILSDLNAKKIRLLTNNPKKVVGLKGYDIEIIDRVPLVMDTNLHNEKYFRTKKEKMGHLY